MRLGPGPCFALLLTLLPGAPSMPAAADPPPRLRADLEAVQLPGPPEDASRPGSPETILAVRTGVEVHPGGAVTWWGESPAGDRVVLVQVGEAQVGTLFRAGGAWILQEGRWIPTPAPPRSACGVRARDLAEVRPPVGSDPRPSKATPVIDFLALYTPRALESVLTLDLLEAHLRQEVAVANNAYRNSQVDARLRLVGLEPLNFQESGILSQDVGRAATHATARALRQQFGADVVGVMLGRATDFCGFAFTEGAVDREHAYFVEYAPCLRGLPTLMAHEIGHLQGLDHNPENAVLGNAVPADAHGHWYDGRYRTVMSYSDPCPAGCPAMPYFSNPAVNHQGLVTGIAGSRNNARVLRTTVGAVAGFETPRVGVPAAPTDLEYAVIGGESGGAVAVELRWRDNAGDERDYLVYRAAGEAGEILRARLPANREIFVDPSIDSEQRYRYRVAASNFVGEASSETVQVDPVPLTAEVRLETADPRAGEVVHFALEVTGPGRIAHWHFGGEETPRGLAVSDPSTDWQAVHIFPRPGVYPVTVEVVGGGRSATAMVEVTVGGEEPPWRRAESLLQSVIHGPRGGGGIFRSHLWLHNGGSEPALVDLGFLPRGLDNAVFQRQGVTLEAGRTLRLEDVVDLLGVDGTGALFLESRVVDRGEGEDPAVYAFGRSFVEVPGSPGSPGSEPGSSFGQRVPEEPEAEWSTEPQWIPGVFHGEETGFLASFQGTNLEDRPGRLSITLLDAAGAEVGQTELGLAARGNRLQRLEQLFPALVAEDASFRQPFALRIEGIGLGEAAIRFSAAVILLDRGSEDQAFLAARPALLDAVDEADAEGRGILPRVVRGPGQFAVTLSTRLVLRNPAASPRRITLDLLERGQENSAPRQAFVDLAAGETRVVEDLLLDLYGIESGAGAVVLRWERAAGSPAPQAVALVLARTAADLRFATTVPLQEPALAGPSALDFGAEVSADFQAAFGVVNLHDGASRIEIVLRDAQGAEVARRELNLRPRQHLERLLLGLFEDLAEGPEWRDLTVETQALAGGPILTYLVNINRSGDIFFVPGPT